MPYWCSTLRSFLPRRVQRLGCSSQAFGVWLESAATSCMSSGASNKTHASDDGHRLSAVASAGLAPGNASKGKIVFSNTGSPILMPPPARHQWQTHAAVGDDQPQPRGQQLHDDGGQGRNDVDEPSPPVRPASWLTGAQAGI